MAYVENPRKQFNFQITIPGLNPFLCQTVKFPDAEFDTAEHGDTNHLIKTAGLKKIGMLEIGKICPADAPDSYMRNWQKTIGNTNTGGGLLPSLYKKPIMVVEFSTDGITPLTTTLFRGAWPKKINGKDLNRAGSDNTLESVSFEVDQDD